MSKVTDQAPLPDPENQEPGQPAWVHSRMALAPLFEGSEHLLIGDSATLHFPGGDAPADKTQLYAGTGMGGQDVKRLLYGQVVTLGGDFYGVPAAPISTSANPQQAFADAYHTLAEASLTEVNKILQILQQEIDAVQAAIDAKQPPSSAYAKLGDSLSYAWNEATGGTWALDPNGRYLALAAVNWDHFGAHAVIAYQAGHSYAMQTAAAIQSANKNPAQKLATLQQAYAYNAFADHFLSDLFSAGHLRTPRKELYDRCTFGAVGSLLARCMHDEDCASGLIVHNANNETWMAYGDKRLRDQPDAENLKRVEAAVQLSVDEVWQAYLSQAPVPAMGALQLIPDLARAGDYNNRENHAALFVVNPQGDVQCRDTLSNMTDFEWEDFTCGTTLLQLKALGWIKDNWPAAAGSFE